MKAAPTMAVKELNKRALTRYLYANGPATKQVLERELGLSLPTITQNLRALEKASNWDPRAAGRRRPSCSSPGSKQPSASPCAPIA